MFLQKVSRRAAPHALRCLQRSQRRSASAAAADAFLSITTSTKSIDRGSPAASDSDTMNLIWLESHANPLRTRMHDDFSVDGASLLQLLAGEYDEEDDGG